MGVRYESARRLLVFCFFDVVVVVVVVSVVTVSPEWEKSDQAIRHSVCPRSFYSLLVFSMKIRP